ncbi:glycosyltransferase [Gemmata sp. G18]|uniref:Glycosyltransferase n=1 Tax=Gemmata palustris TaxID=2822762 RepID=A0ABS5C269_9BACT|nr:glycosyltransferase family 2 protein [Gemmata palustris]MBP3960056.1 glycosyltransferase [Gemmata palustris]
MGWLEPVAWVVVVVLAVPLIVLAVECFAAVRRVRPAPLPDASARPRCAVLIPAHNEELVIARTLLDISAQLRPGDRVVVVADNCTDGTAAIARAHGVEVAERTDPTRRGKGYALAFGRDALSADPPEVVVVIDADCTAGDQTLHRLVAEARARRRPVQGSYLMVAPPQAGPNRQVAAFAFLVKNFARPLGLRRLGQGCLLMGTGMAFPWDVFKGAPLAHGHIVEDLGLTVDLALLGLAPVFAPDAEVRGEFPIDDRAAGVQRRRWEHGHLRVMLAGIPQLLATAVFRRRLGLVALALDVGVPPLSALVLTVGAVLAILGIWAALGGPWAPVAALGGAGLFAGVALATVWWRYGRGVLPAKSLLRVPLYAARKIPLYLRFLVKPQRDWVRTARDQPHDKT